MTATTYIKKNVLYNRTISSRREKCKQPIGIYNVVSVWISLVICAWY